MVERSTIVITDSESRVDFMENLSLVTDRVRSLVFALPQAVLELTKIVRKNQQVNIGIHMFATIPNIAKADLFNQLCLNRGHLLNFSTRNGGAFVVATFDSAPEVLIPNFESFRININLPPHITTLKIPYELLDSGGQDDYAFIESE